MASDTSRPAINNVFLKPSNASCCWALATSSRVLLARLLKMGCVKPAPILAAIAPASKKLLNESAESPADPVMDNVG